jgi:hypothetical protein
MDFDGIEAAKSGPLGSSDQISIGDLAGTDLKAAASTSAPPAAGATARRTP